jgi:hypothetical protein
MMWRVIVSVHVAMTSEKADDQRNGNIIIGHNDGREMVVIG